MMRPHAWAVPIILLTVAVALRPSAAPLAAQPPPASPTPAATAILPPPLIAGDWSVGRSWYRRCPRCGFPVNRTTAWHISQFGIEVDVDKGLRGTIVGAPGGGGYLTLAGVESSGPEVYRFIYATLRVRADGAYFEGGFDGTETIMNPCGDDPPMVSCFASAGWLTAHRVGPAPTAGPPVPTGLPTPFPLPSDTPTRPPTVTPTPSVTPPPPTATPTASASATPTPRPLWRAFLPRVTVDITP